MKLSPRLPKPLIDDLIQASKLEELTLAEIAGLVREEIADRRYLPDSRVQIDPRTGEHIVYHSARVSRVHDNLPQKDESDQPSEPCLICEGRTTGIIDVAPLSQGFTFINKNLFPVLYPFKEFGGGFVGQQSRAPLPETSLQGAGLHFLQWTSSIHDRDWHNMPLDDLVLVMNRLAVLEKKLLEEPLYDGEWAREGFREPQALIFKNYGYLVGGSLAHGHQQIALSSVMPRRFEADHQFMKREGLTFSSFMQTSNPEELQVKDYGPAVLLVPYFMRRPYDMLLLVKDTRKRHLHELTTTEMTAIALGWKEAIAAVRKIMPKIGREIAYNVVTHNGPGGGLYFEFLPYTQEIGGFEHLGLIVCQGDPYNVAEQLVDLVDGGG